MEILKKYIVMYFTTGFVFQSKAIEASILDSSKYSEIDHAQFIDLLTR